LLYESRTAVPISRKRNRRCRLEVDQKDVAEIADPILGLEIGARRHLASAALFFPVAMQGNEIEVPDGRKRQFFVAASPPSTAAWQKIAA
jgi:hypothetical protein